MKRFIKPEDQFRSENYLRHNLKRLEHLDSLNIDFIGKKLLEVGAGVGDHTQHLLSKGCSFILTTEARPENLEVLKERFKNERNVQVEYLNMEAPRKIKRMFDIVYCYGLLYHLSTPRRALKFLAKHTKELLLVETCVSYHDENGINLCDEKVEMFSQSISGKGCRPGRKWVFKQLKKQFEFVYLPITQPDHEQFPTDWTRETWNAKLTRAIFIASRKELRNPLLINEIPMHQTNRKNYEAI